MNRASHYRQAERLAETAVRILVAERARIAALPPGVMVLNDTPLLRIADLYLRAAAVHEGLATAPEPVAARVADVERRQARVVTELAKSPPAPAGDPRPGPHLFNVSKERS